MSSNKRVHSILLQLHKAIKQLQTWNENVISPDDYYTSPEGMKNLAASCMLIEAIGEGIKMERCNRNAQPHCTRLFRY